MKITQSYDCANLCIYAFKTTCLSLSLSSSFSTTINDIKREGREEEYHFVVAKRRCGCCHGSHDTAVASTARRNTFVECHVRRTLVVDQSTDVFFFWIFCLRLSGFQYLKRTNSVTKKTKTHTLS